MIFGIGTDIVEIARIKDAVEKYGKRFLDRIYSDNEQTYCESFKDNKYQHYAARFAAKEAFSKAIGTGITQGFKFREIAIENETSGKPIVCLSGGLLNLWGNYDIHISLSHTDNNAVAYLLIADTIK